MIEAVTDPEVPPLPPHITFKQAKNFAASILKRDPNARGMIRQAFKDVLENYLPHNK